MKRILNLKIASLIFFLALILPFGKLEMFNGVIIMVNVISIFTDPSMVFLDYLSLVLVIIGIVTMLSKKRSLNIIGFLFSYLWLIYKCSWNDFLNSYSVSISIFIYLVLSIYTITTVFISKKEEGTIN